MPPISQRSIRKWLTVGVVSIIVVIVGYFGTLYWYKDTHLLVTNTQPTDTQTAATATTVIIWFNRPIAASTTKNFSISPNTAGKTTVSGNKLTFTPSSLLSDDTTYTVTLSRAISADSKYSMGNFSFTFKAGYVPYDQQPKDVQQRGLQLTDTEPPQLAFFGDDDLTNQGVTSAQLTSVEDYLKKLFDKSKKTDYVINIDSVQAEPYDSTSDNPSQIYDFNIEMNEVTYKAKLYCYQLDDSARLIMYNAKGEQVQDSGILY